MFVPSRATGNTDRGGDFRQAPVRHVAGKPRSRRRGASKPPPPQRLGRSKIPPLNRILLVEDDPDTQVIASFALCRGGFVFDVCGTGVEALEKAPTFAPDLILLDVMLPFMDGPAILHEMRGRHQLAATPVIFMTARALPEEIAHYRRLGSLDVIVKPFDPMTLAESIQGIWSRHHRAWAQDEREGLRELARLYLAQLPTRVSEISEAARRIPTSREAAEELFYLAHRLTGSSATLGFTAVSDAARSFEALAESRLSAAQARLDRRLVQRLIVSLQSAARDTASGVAPRPDA